MFRWPKQTRRLSLVVLHDVVVSLLAILAAFYLRFEEDGINERRDLLLFVLPAFAVYSGLVYVAFDLYRSKWRFVSLPDLIFIFRASTVLALSLLILDYILIAPNVYAGFFFGKTTIILYWLLQMFFLSGPRLIYRYFRHSQTKRRATRIEAIATLALGRTADVEVLLRAIESGAVGKIRVVGILSPSDADQRHTLRGVPVLGGFDDLERVAADISRRGVRILRLVLTPSALVPDAKPESILIQAQRLGIVTSRMPSLGEGGPIRLAPIAVEDLLLRPSVEIDYARIEGAIRGRSVIVTGGGGSIGSELCRRVVDFGAKRLMIIENSEPSLYRILEGLALGETGCQLEGHVADIRDRQRMFDLFSEFHPDIVFHAAALKHVPILERDWGEGIKTNVFGSVNVADATVAADAKTLVLISTDKAVEPVSVLGATKRLAEQYCQALDADIGARSNGIGASTRLIAVRFGNVLASDGSVVPKFKAQIEAGGPITVTHPDMVRYFMTIREACDLVATAASHALAQNARDVSVYVLNMGQPVKISALAERMIRLSGLEPGVDIEVAYTGIRPGERLNETLFSPLEPTVEIGIAGIVGATPTFPTLEEVRVRIAELERGLACGERGVIFQQ